MAEKTRLILLFGGQSCEHEVSVTSARSVVEAVDRDRYDLTLVGIGKDGRWWLQSDPRATFTANRVIADDAMAVYLDYCRGGVLPPWPLNRVVK